VSIGTLGMPDSARDSFIIDNHATSSSSRSYSTSPSRSSAGRSINLEMIIKHYTLRACSKLDLDRVEFILPRIKRTKSTEPNRCSLNHELDSISNCKQFMSKKGIDNHRRKLIKQSKKKLFPCLIYALVGLGGARGML